MNPAGSRWAASSLIGCWIAGHGIWTRIGHQAVNALINITGLISHVLIDRTSLQISTAAKNHDTDCSTVTRNTMLQFLTLLFLLLTTALANVEKTIFLAPTPSPLSSSSNITPDLSDLGLDLLSPENTILRTKLNASFPSTAQPYGTESWFLLEGLNPGQRYEVRVCWLATQPTSFTLSTYPLDAIIDDPSLLASISHFSSARLASVDVNNPKEIVPQVPNSHHAPRRPLRRTQSRDSDSVLFLRIHAAADYFTNEQGLMENVQPVIADVILDPFLGNVFPKSLMPTACWGLVVGVAAVGIAKWIVKEFGRVVLLGVGSGSAAGSAEKKGQ